MASEEKDYEVVKGIPLDMLKSGFGTRTEDFIGKKAYDKIIDAFERAILNPKDRSLIDLKTFVNGLCAYLENNQADIEAFRRKKFEDMGRVIVSRKKKLEENN